MDKMFYMAMESYQSRYTGQLLGWSLKEYEMHFNVHIIRPAGGIGERAEIRSGSVLDSVARTTWGLRQVASLIDTLQNTNTTNEDLIFLEDMFQPGLDGLAYFLSFLPKEKRPRLFMRCMAQSVDPDDFIHREGLAPWMRAFEKMACHIPTETHVLATNEEMVANMHVAGWNEYPCFIHNIGGLTFNGGQVRHMLPEDKMLFHQRPEVVSFASRLDSEKQPHFFLDLAEEDTSATEYWILSGKPLVSDDPTVVPRIRELMETKRVRVFDNLTKGEYYKALNQTRVLFNCALQDWTSYTACEASALGCNLVFPAYRSFPETFCNDPRALYIPWSKESAKALIADNLRTYNDRNWNVQKHNTKTVQRIVDIFKGDRQYQRNSLHYRQRASYNA